MNRSLYLLGFIGILGLACAELSFNFTIPYAGAGNLIVNNNGGEISISTLSFTTNAIISGSPWGALFPWSASLTQTTSGILTTYTISYSSAISISGSMSMTYSYTSTGGPLLNLGMAPSSVNVVSGGTTMDVPIDGSCKGSDCDDPTPGRHSAGYYTSWGMYARQYDAIDIPVRYINQIYYGFIGYHPDGSLYLLDSNSDPKQIPVISQLMQKFPYLHASLSFGGWTLSGGFSQLANNTQTINTFVQNVLAALQQTGFDGVDIDWEYPIVNGAPGEPTHSTPQDAHGYPNLMASLRSGLDDLAESNRQAGVGSTYYRLSIAGAGGVDKLDAITQYNPEAWPMLVKSIDVVNVMTYDFHGAFDQSQPAPYDVSDFMSAFEIDPIDPFYNSSTGSQYDVVSPIAKYMSLGFTSKQMSVGLPAYGRLVMVEQLGSTTGLYQKITGTPPGQYDSTGVFDYKCIQERDCHGYLQLPSDIAFVNPDQNPLGNYSHTPWGYSASTSTFLTFDNAQSARFKTCWANTQNLYGYMIWDLTGDFPPSDSNSLVGAATSALLGNC